MTKNNIYIYIHTHTHTHTYIICVPKMYGSKMGLEQNKDISMDG